MYAILDIESTGGKYNEEGIMEIAIHKFDGENVIDRFSSLVNPEREIQPFVVKLTGINNKMLRTAPKFHEVAKRIIEITEDTTLVAHNAQFDYRILRTEFRRLGYNFERKTLCTVDLSKKLLPDAESHSLGKLVRSLGIPVSDRHRANGDALATLKLFKLLLVKDTDKSIIKQVVRSETLGELTARQLDIVESLPTALGIYYMFDKDGKLLFLGKANNIKKRVNQHFTNQGKLGRTLQKLVKKVSFETTGNKLAAQLKEKQEIHINRPLFNKRSKKQTITYGIYSHELASGHSRLVIEPVNGQQSRISTFSSCKSATNFLNKLVAQQQMDHQRLEGFNNQSINELRERYSTADRSFLMVLKGRQLGEKCVFLIKQGHYQGYGYVELNHQINNIAILESLITPAHDKIDATLIIETYLRENNVQMVELEG